MKWKQFLTPVQSLTNHEAQTIIDSTSQEDLILLDVRQESEYVAAHLPGATLLPLGDLDQTYDQIDKEKIVIVYCAVGGRSRVAAQMLSGKGFTRLYNLNGGINSWENEIAVGSQDAGLELYESVNSVEEAIIIGFGVEQGLREFYLKAAKSVTEGQARDLFLLLGEIEIKHQNKLLEIYTSITGVKATYDDFALKVVQPAMEGGISTDQYIELYNPDFNSEFDILSMAMSIEAQALDLYTRAANLAEDTTVRNALFQIASEEKIHLSKLAEYIDNL